LEQDRDFRSMARLTVGLAVLALSSTLAAVAALAQVQPRTCGVLDGPGCNPNQCSILDGPGCLAEPQRSLGENLQLTLTTRAAGEARKPDGELNTIRDLFAALRSCWAPPAAERGHPGMQMSLRFSLSREGNLIGEPRVTFATRAASEQTRDVYHDAFTQSLRECTPLRITRSFAGALAGRPIVVRVIDNRDDVAREKPGN
jgi:hypothetical protein